MRGVIIRNSPLRMQTNGSNDLINRKSEPYMTSLLTVNVLQAIKTNNNLSRLLYILFMSSIISILKLIKGELLEQDRIYFHSRFEC